MNKRSRAGAQRPARLRLASPVPTDPLTGLPGRATFSEALSAALAADRRGGSAVAVLFFGIDRFEVINGTFGHDSGDALLTAVAQRLSPCQGPDEFLARFAGDEFTMLLTGITHPSEAIAVARRLLDTMQWPFVVNGHEVFMTGSIGIALGIPGFIEPPDLLRDAHVAMRHAKHGGRGNHVVFDPVMNADAQQRLNLDTDLHRALERHELRLNYQPTLDTYSGVITGFEALLRWYHPRHGIISPTQFIPLAEENGLILPIGQWVLSEACRQARLWTRQLHGRQPLTISVNISGRQLQHPGLIDDVVGAITRHGVDPASICLEITETVAMHDGAHALAVLGDLKRIGVRLAIDDFGTGYSSLSYLRRFPIDVIKIDQSFVRELPDDRGSQAIVSAITSFAHALDMQVTAEGVETDEQLARLRLLNCDQVQGFLFSRPIAADAASALLDLQLAP